MFRFGPQNVHELAENVVSTVKSGLFRVAAGVAAGLFWGSAPTPPPGENLTFLTV